MQIAAYAMAHDYIHGSSIEQGIIMVCTPDLYLQEFKFQGVELRQWKHKFLKRLDEYYGSEVTLFYPGLYAGTTDLICKHNDMDTIVDFKQANQPKRKEWIDDYYMQIAAYAMAHDYIHGSNIGQGIIMVCTPDLYLQEFRFQGAELRMWKHEFLKRLDAYYELIRDYKEEAQIDTQQLLKEFEKDSWKNLPRHK